MNIPVATLARACRLLLTAALLLAGSPSALRAQSDAPHKGPIGWETYRQLDRLPELTRGVRTHQFSSFARDGSNNDGFQGTFSCLRESERGCVIAEAEGPGEVQSLWFTRDGGNVQQTGTITIELDGQVVVQEDLQRLVNGEAGAPFIFPLVANADQSSGGVYVKVPMPYRRSMRITVQNNPRFYHVTYRTFSDADGVATFDPSEPAQDVLERLRQWGEQSPLSAEADHTTEESFSLPAGQSVVLADLSGPAQITELQFQFPQLVRSRGPFWDDGRAHTGYSEFTVSVDPENEGVRLTRRFGAGVANQEASISVDGEQVARWEPGNFPNGHWGRQSVELPASATSGKSEITVRNTFISSNLDFNEFSYFVESRVNGEFVPTDTVDVGPQSLENERAHDYQISQPNWQGARNFFHSPEEIKERTPKVLPTDSLLRGLWLQIAFDGKTTVDAPVGEFFGTGLGEYDVRTLFFAVDDLADRFTAWWPMPFAQSAQVRLINTSGVDLDESHFEAAYTTEGDDVASALSEGRLGYFHATARRGEPTANDDWLFLNQTGRGKLVGVSHTMHGHEHQGNLRGYLEGDLRIYVDSSNTPQLYGTGTEDFYEGGWYFNRNAFHLPFNGNTAHEDFLGGTWGVPSGDAPPDTEGTLGCPYSCDSAYRLLIGDAVPFDMALRAGMEHGPQNEFPGWYGSTAFWYGHAEAPALEKTDVLDIGNAESEQAHNYQTEGDSPSASPLPATFEGDFNDERIIDQRSGVEQPVSFTLTVAPPGDTASGPVLLRRRTDQEEGYQAARVFVDDTDVGTWLQPLHNTTHRWLEDAFWLPQRLTEGKRTVDVRLEPLSDAPPWQAARYEAFAYTESTPVSIDETYNAVPPARPRLVPNHPNPFSERTVIRFEVDMPSHVQLAVYDARGKRVRVLTDRTVDAGAHHLTWHPSSSLASGVYFLRLRAGEHDVTRAATFVR